MNTTRAREIKKIVMVSSLGFPGTLKVEGE